MAGPVPETFVTERLAAHRVVLTRLALRRPAAAEEAAGRG